MSAPLLNDFLLQNVVLIEFEENFGNSGNELWVVNSDDPFNASKERLLVLF
jgi:hypothetical protein